MTPNAGSGELELSVYDIHGRAISSVKVGNGVDFNNLVVGLADRSGVYIVILKEDGVVKDSKKIIK
ncbi:MAG: T9SS type A sorting domain-containing protein [Bacteroidales bacterium]|nr:T9SS type A sorting domain-containing protein [Bacteroidales bacterium]